VTSGIAIQTYESSFKGTNPAGARPVNANCPFGVKLYVAVVRKGTWWNTWSDAAGRNASELSQASLHKVIATNLPEMMKSATLAIKTEEWPAAIRGKMRRHVVRVTYGNGRSCMKVGNPTISYK